MREIGLGGRLIINALSFFCFPVLVVSPGFIAPGFVDQQLDLVVRFFPKFLAIRLRLVL